MPANQCNQGITCSDSLFDGLNEVQSGLNGIDVREDMIPPKVLAEPIIDPIGPPATVIAPVAMKIRAKEGFFSWGREGGALAS